MGMWKLGIAALFIATLGSGAPVTLSLDEPPPREQLDGALPLEQRCGNYACEPPETCQTCPSDCGDCCGNP